MLKAATLRRLVVFLSFSRVALRAMTVHYPTRRWSGMATMNGKTNGAEHTNGDDVSANGVPHAQDRIIVGVDFGTTYGPLQLSSSMKHWLIMLPNAVGIVESRQRIAERLRISTLSRLGLEAMASHPTKYPRRSHTKILHFPMAGLLATSRQRRVPMAGRRRRYAGVSSSNLKSSACGVSSSSSIATRSCRTLSPRWRLRHSCANAIVRSWTACPTT